MIKQLLFSLLVLGFSSVSNAEQTYLNCKLKEGNVIPNLMIDLNSKIMRFGEFTYDIIHMNDTYITGLLRTSEVGGEIWVINRINGDFERQGVSIYFEDQIDGGAIIGTTASGRCSARLI